MWRLVRRVGSPIALIVAMTSVIAASGSYYFDSTAAAVAFIRGESLYVDGAERDLGEVRSGEARLVRYRLTNLTRSSIRFLGSQSSCECTTVGPIPSSLLPAESVIIEVTYKPENVVAGRAYWGKLVLFSDDPRHHELQLTFSARVATDPNVEFRQQS